MKSRYILLMFVFGFFLTSISYAEQQTKGEFLQWQYKLSGEERFRTEYKQDFDLNESAKDNGSLFFNRVRLGFNAGLTDEYLNRKMDIFVEALDAQTGGYQIKATANQTDDFDLHQAYVNMYNVLGSDFDIKAGRQEMKYGKGRLIAAPTWANRIRSLDAGVIHYHKDALWADMLYGQDVKYDDGQTNTSRSEDFLTGMYGGYQKNKVSPLFETYFLSLIDIKGLTNTHRYTAGGRIQLNIADGTVLDMEFPYQFGETGTLATTKNIKAYAYHVDVTKNWDLARWKPKVMVGYDEASGDKDTKDRFSNTFIPIYQTTHEPYGLLDFFRWENVRNPEVSMTFSPTDKFRFTPQMDFFWLQSKFDSWYNSSGTVVRTKTSGDRGYYVGNEVSIRGYYDFNANIKWESGYAHFFPGGYAKDTGVNDDVDWVYSQITLKY